MPCPQCYETDASICPKATNPASNCSGFILNAVNQRTALGDYPASLKNTLPHQARAADGPHFDALLGYTATTNVLVALSEEAQPVADDLDLLVANNMNLSVEICEKRPALRRSVEARLDFLTVGATGPVCSQIGHFTQRIRNIEADEKSKKIDLKPVTGAMYKATNYPLSTLFQTIVKAAAKGVEMPDEGKEFFDAVTGKTYVPFAKMVKLDSGPMLVHCVHTFVTSVIVLKSEAPRVYYDFTRDVVRVVEDKGPRFGQEYVDQLLRFLDEKRFPSMVSLYATGEPTRTFTEMASRMSNDGDGKGRKNPDGLKPGELGGPNGPVKFGPVTTPIGGAGAGWIKKQCNRFHCNPKMPCTAGIPPNAGFPADKVGLCAYIH